jgi:hypothetical protein
VLISLLQQVRGIPCIHKLHLLGVIEEVSTAVFPRPIILQEVWVLREGYREKYFYEKEGQIKFSSDFFLRQNILCSLD